MEVLENSIRCFECRCILDLPVLLPCGQSVCQKHIQQDLAQYTCLCCGDDHPVPEDGFYLNKALQNIIGTQIANIKLIPQYDEAFRSCKKLSACLERYNFLKNDPYFFIYEALYNLKNETQIIREEYKLKIDEKADKIMDCLKNFEAECSSNLKSTDLSTEINEMDQIVSVIKDDLAESQKKLGNFGSNELVCSDIKINNDKYVSELESKFDQIKNDLLLSWKYEDIKFKIMEFTNIELHSDWSLEGSLMSKFSSKFDSKILDAKSQNELEKLCGFSVDQKWKLLYRASKDGFSSKKFHIKCDNFPSTLTIIKSSNGNIFGGYTDAMWDRANVYRSDRRAFIFSLVNKYGIGSKMTVNNETGANAIVGHSEYGPIFGTGKDILIANNSNTNVSSSSNLGGSYKHPFCLVNQNEAKNYLASSFHFQVAEIEVYQKL